jgi:hypothetical protein
MWHQGDVWEPEIECVEGEPGSWAFTFESQRGVLTTGTPVKVKAQVWKAAQELTEPGTWKLSCTTTSPYKGATSAQIPVSGVFG